MLLRNAGRSRGVEATRLRADFRTADAHPGAGIITSFPGLGPLTGTGMLAEIGDDRSGFTDARGLKAYAWAAPVTRASGSGVLRHRVKNQRLAAIGYTWAFAAPTAFSTTSSNSHAAAA